MKRMVFVLMLLSAGILAPAAPALADAAPPPPDPGNTIQNQGQTTNVRMVSEDVLITITDDQAVIHASFQLRNMGTTEEAFDVWFPDGIYREDMGKVEHHIIDFSAAVDGAPAVIGTSYAEHIREGCPETQCRPVPIPWKTWPVIFPVGQTVSVSVDYALPPARYYSDSFDLYAYVLSTGAGWYGTIGHGKVTVRLPYEVTPDNVNPEPDDYLVNMDPDYYRISGTDIIWEFDDLEPTSDDNIDVFVMRPADWRGIQTAERNVEASPDSVDAHAALARALAHALNTLPYRGNLRQSEASLRMYDRAVDEYRRVVEMAPGSFEYRRRYLSLLAPAFVNDRFCPEMARALADFPDEPILHDPRSYDISRCGALIAQTETTVTQTPAPAVTRQPTLTPAEEISATSTALTGPDQTTIQEDARGNQRDNSDVSSLLVIIGGIILTAAIGAVLYFRAKSGAH
jgi:hypothetical protein